MRVLVTGADGQLGRALVPVLADDTVVAAGREVDVGDEPAVAALVAGAEPEVVIHAAAMTDVDACERDPDAAHRTNALGAWWVARACRRVGATMVMISTDHVFAGDLGRPLTEFDPVAPVNAYGRAKAAGEALVRETLPEHHIVRTAWLAGPSTSNFVTTMLRLGRSGDPVSVVDDQLGSPTFVDDLAAAIREVAASGRFGTVHRSNAGGCSRFELAAAVFELVGIEVDLRRIGSDQLDRPARRPADARLSNRHAELSGLTPMRPWRDALAALLGTVPDPASGDGS